MANMEAPFENVSRLKTKKGNELVNVDSPPLSDWSVGDDVTSSKS